MQSVAFLFCVTTSNPKQDNEAKVLARLRADTQTQRHLYRHLSREGMAPYLWLKMTGSCFYLGEEGILQLTCTNMSICLLPMISFHCSLSYKLILMAHAQCERLATGEPSGVIILQDPVVSGVGTFIYSCAASAVTHYNSFLFIYLTYFYLSYFYISQNAFDSIRGGV